eukprot:TRINITY_DN15432_c0_g1_i1.p1 TRINITY_DN15432_c0_g1~~TRINITY_DN15432_c0_g1_i1.p1  ORF type:complete len:106 (+),score=4.85 TRINITY_DN15432_c0_g1_i1:2-319(+)
MFQSPSKLIRRLAVAFAISGSLGMGNAQAADQEILNSSYDIARELFASYNELFAKHWQEESGKTVEIKQSHGGSSKQAQAIIQGLRADVVLLYLQNQINKVPNNI